ncbi:MAG: hypothetical protein ACQEQF_04870 [Bacillota bacterium]
MTKYKKMMAVFLLVMAVGVVFTGCAGNSGEPVEEEGTEDSLETPEGDESAPAESDDLGSTDDLSGQIEIPQNINAFA